MSIVHSARNLFNVLINVNNSTISFASFGLFLVLQRYSHHHPCFCYQQARLDHCGPILVGLPVVLITCFDRVLPCAARLIEQWAHTKMCYCHGLYARHAALASSCSAYILYSGLAESSWQSPCISLRALQSGIWCIRPSSPVFFCFWPTLGIPRAITATGKWVIFTHFPWHYYCQTAKMEFPTSPWYLLYQAACRGVIPPEAMMHFSLFQISPRISEKNVSYSVENVSDCVEDFSRVLSAKIFDDFCHWLQIFPYFRCFSTFPPISR